MPKPIANKLQSILYNDSTDQPKPTKAGAGVLFYAKSTARYLVLRRSSFVKEPYTWSGVGGKIDPGEGPFETAKREVFEEMGVDPAARYFLVFVFKSDHHQFKYFNFLGVVDKEFTPTLNDENIDYEWVSWDDLVRMPKKHYGLQSLIKNGGAKIKSIISTPAT